MSRFLFLAYLIVFTVCVPTSASFAQSSIQGEVVTDEPVGSGFEAGNYREENSLSIVSTERQPDSSSAQPQVGYEYGAAPPIQNGVTPKLVQWKSGEVRHRRLLFEEPLLERQGLTRNQSAQPLISGGNFLYKSVLLPFELIKKHHRRCESGSGWGVPGTRNGG